MKAPLSSILLAALVPMMALGQTDDNAEGAYNEENIYINYSKIMLDPTAQKIIVGVTIVTVFVLMALEWAAPEVLFLCALMIVTLLQILSLDEALSGFSNGSVVTIGTLFLVVGAVDKSHIVDWLARKTFGLEGPAWIGKARLYMSSFCLSIFFNNTPLVAILMPVVKDWGRMRNIAASQLLIPLSYSVLAGSFMSMIGTSTNLTIQGLMVEDRGYAFEFFAPAPIGAACFAVLLPYMIIAGPYLLPNNRSGLLREARDQAKDLIAEVYVSEHSSAVGKTLGDMMNSLGISPSYCVKIRRCSSEMEKAKRISPSESPGGPLGGPNLDRPTTPSPSLEGPNNGNSNGSGGKMNSAFIFSNPSSRGGSVNDLQDIQQTQLDGPTKRIRTSSSNSAEKERATRAGSLLDVKLDVDYLSRQRSFWFAKQPTLPDRLDKSDHGKEKSEEKAGGDIEMGRAVCRPCENTYHDLVVPDPHEIIVAKDVVFISSAQDAVEKMMKSIMGESRGLFILKSNVMSLPGFGAELIECVVSESNPFVGMKVSEISQLFADRYKAGIITVRGKGYTDPQHRRPEESKDADDATVNENGEVISANRSGSHQLINMRKLLSGNTMTNISRAFGLSQESNRSGSGKNTPSKEAHANTHGTGVESKVDEEIMVNGFYSAIAQDKDKDDKFSAASKHHVPSEHVLGYGDTILCVTTDKEIPSLEQNKDFYVVSTVGALPKPLNSYLLIPVFIFVVMLVLVAAEMIEITPAALSVTAIFLVGGWVKATDIPRLVDIRLLMLMACAISFSQAVGNSGLANAISSLILSANPSDFGAQLLVYIITLACTEMVSNNAAASLMYPIAVSLADGLGADYRTFAMTVLVASTAGFMSPIGYQTHVMVWGPGGYAFKDYLIFGFVPDVTYWILGCAVIQAIFPFH